MMDILAVVAVIHAINADVEHHVVAVTTVQL